MALRILAVDDDPDVTRLLAKLLAHEGYEVRTENDSREALHAAKEFHPHVAILDYLMPHAHGGDVAWQLWSDPLLRKVRIIVCTIGIKEEIARCLPPTVIPILQKPYEPAALLALLKEWAQILQD